MPLPSHFKELQIIDDVLRDFFESKLNFRNKFLYVPSQENIDLIAKTFDIDVSNLDIEQKKKILKSPMLSKTRLGTKEAILDAISKIYADVSIQTNKEDKKLRSFEFSLKASIKKDINEEILKAISNIIEEVKPIRDNLAGIDFEMPKQKSNIKLKTSLQWRL
ncbi:phage tail protein [Helicobacter cappadocius]|uniref:Phage tail protein n=1 Tax=Helicobacter cappadocius TaxID=3063998 RepID=A0AA90ST95_9HELI|nr:MULTISPECIES: phage tail protein [unclassified Helicobacter]MDO7253888.1 phage tail protein [Helicobacter sp. faydin-H75]MDP2539749.1 phage tail protein [Helicobacter sp. faydin-H76]